MFLRMAALGEGVIGIALKGKLNRSYEVVRGLVQGPVEYIHVGKDVKGEEYLGAHASRAGTSVRILARILRYVSVRETLFFLGGKEDVHSCISALILGLKCSKGEISQ